jgi:hypothetical protein
MWIDFFLQNSHFVLSLFAALVFFAVFWLHFDAWLAGKDLKEAVKFTGFLFLSASFLIHSTHIESSLLSQTLGDSSLGIDLGNLSRLVGYLLIIVGQIIDPLQQRPDTSVVSKPNASVGLFLPSKLSFLAFSFPILALSVGLFYLRRATVGLERHLKPVAISFFLLALSEILSLAVLFRNSDNIDCLTW